MTIFLRARGKVQVENELEFRALAFALQALAAGESGTRTYRWFSEGSGTYAVLEEYADAAAALAHNQRAAGLLARLSDTVDITEIELYGEIGPDLEAYAAGLPQASVYRELLAPPATA
ncbi:antibiotic biosynthesis monooxygenase [Amycolatopsis sp. NBC_00345]|uniref:antibiotic biosynthesis monooxygenase n=1 Tax=Amycolatopsis sp. NBC_00345 TaxID=2975955 RepID=UPI002E2565D3